MTKSNQFFCNQVQPQILGINPYVPGKPVSELQRELGLTYISKLASNENPLGISHKVLMVVQKSLKDTSRYPDGSAFELKVILAKLLDVTASQIAIGNGSNELLELVARVFAGKGDEIIYSQYAFAVYPISAQVVGATGIEVPSLDWGHDLSAMLAAITPKTKLIYIANPNNPTGTRFNQTQWESFISQVPKQVVVVLDEAYLEYAKSFDVDNDYPDGCDYIEQYPNLLISRTFSKAYGLAALRIGYLLGCDEIIEYINTLRNPFNVNSLAQVAACTALLDTSFLAKSIALNKQGMQQLIDGLDALNISHIPSSGNFVCIFLGSDALEINQKLLEEGVIVRPLANYKLPQFLRISIGTQIENQHFIDALTLVLNR